MKTSLPSQKIIPRSWRIAALICLPLLLASVSRVQAQYTLVSGSTFVNVYLNDGGGNTFGTSPYFLGNTINGEGTPLSSYATGSWLTTGATTPAPGAASGGVYNSLLQTLANAQGQVSYQQNNLFFGSNWVSQSTISPYGTSLYLVNNTFAGIAELRLDWTATYNFSGFQGLPTWTALTHYALGAVVGDSQNNLQICTTAGISGGGTPLWNTTTIGGTTHDGTVTWTLQGENAPDNLQLSINGTLHNFSAVAGEATFTVYNGFNATGGVAGTATGTIGPGGDTHFLTAPITFPASLAALAPHAIFWGYDVTSPFAAAPAGLGGPLPTIAGNSITVSGFLDLFVDPGSIQVSITPPLGIKRVNSQSVVYWPSSLTNFVLESTTNLVSRNWVTNNSTVTTNNGTNSITVNSATGTTFFRLKH